MRRQLSILVLGEAGTGKTSLIHSFLSPEKTLSVKSNLYEDVYSCVHKDGETHVNLEIIDVCSNAIDTSYVKLRMASCEAFILMYSKEDMSTSDRLESLKEEILQAKYYKPDVPIFVVGNQLDLPGVLAMHGTELANMVVWDWEKDYREVSTSHGWKVRKVFEDLIKKSLMVYNCNFCKPAETNGGITSLISKAKGILSRNSNNK